jgi:hypothetical protein
MFIPLQHEGANPEQVPFMAHVTAFGAFVPDPTQQNCGFGQIMEQVTQLKPGWHSLVETHAPAIPTPPD